ncbi:MAG: DinB family protein [Chitinophagaceae bacterium]
MRDIAAELESFIDDCNPKLHLLQEEELVEKSIPGKWSKKELIGHLIDSAQNNIRRFIMAQYEENPIIIYNQDKWVNINNYQKADATDLINLWYLLNKQAANVLKITSDEVSHATCQTENLHTIEWLAKDYIKHLRHHIHQVLDLEPVAYP